MPVLHSESHPHTNISALIDVLTYVNNTGHTLTVLCKVELGSPAVPIVGNGNYQLETLLDGAPIRPSSIVLVDAKPYIVLQSREITVQIGQTIIVQAVGRPSDVDVDVESMLMDVTPATLSDVVGNGNVPVDHNYGGPDELRIVDPSGAGVSDATIVSYLEADYVNGDRGSTFVKGRTTTNVNGRWRSVIMLDPEAYILTISKPGAIQGRTYELTVL